MRFSAVVVVFVIIVAIVVCDRCGFEFLFLLVFKKNPQKVHKKCCFFGKHDVTFSVGFFFVL